MNVDFFLVSTVHRLTLDIAKLQKHIDCHEILPEKIVVDELSSRTFSHREVDRNTLGAYRDRSYETKKVFLQREGH
jgi:hypothetical protein